MDWCCLPLEFEFVKYGAVAVSCFWIHPPSASPCLVLFCREAPTLYYACFPSLAVSLLNCSSFAFAFTPTPASACTCTSVCTSSSAGSAGREHPGGVRVQCGRVGRCWRGQRCLPLRRQAGAANAYYKGKKRERDTRSMGVSCFVMEMSADHLYGDRLH